MTFASLKVGGLRGFAVGQCVDFARPTGEAGSGLTVLLGANNSGKSTIIEALNVLATRSEVSFPVGRRNVLHNDGQVVIELIRPPHDNIRLSTVLGGGSETLREGDQELDLVVIPSRRAFNPNFGKPYLGHGRQWHKAEVPDRYALRDSFTARLFTMNNEPARRTAFDVIMKRIVGRDVKWRIDQSDQGTHYVEFSYANSTRHSSEGLGEGLVSLLFIVDALHDSSPESMIVIDEPELSLHPQLQRRLREVLSELASDRQIVYSTHSPYLISWDDLAAGAAVVRVIRGDDGSEVFQPSSAAMGQVAALRADRNNPHLLGLNANEVFFVEDGLLLVEGQEDVVLLPRIAKELGLGIDANIFGWGAGGADKFERHCQLFQELGFRRVVVVVDGDRSEVADSLRAQFPEYEVLLLPADDIRTKPAIRERPEKAGLMGLDGLLSEELRDSTATMLRAANTYIAEGKAAAGKDVGLVPESARESVATAAPTVE